MEITNEIKAKVFAQYLGQKVNAEGSRLELISVCFNHIVCYNPPIGEVEGDEVEFDFSIYLMLKPLSAITDEDAIEVAKITQENESYHNAGVGKMVVKGKWKFNMEKYFFIHQFLQSKGYDLPNYLLGGKTLHEAGLAIYE